MEPTHSVSVAGADWLALPAGAAVVALEDDAGRTLLVATTGDARRWARSRLGEGDGGGVDEQSEGNEPRRARVDHRAVTARVLAWSVGSAFEAEWVYLAVARERLPRVYKVVAERWRAWFVRVDAGEEFPEFTKTNLAMGAGAGVPARRAGGRESAKERTCESARGGEEMLLGPLADKDAAGRYIEAIVDVFDLCRFQRILVQAPRGAACAYKEMGRCAAPCDGTESMEAYRARVRGAARALGSGDVLGGLDGAVRERAGALVKGALAEVRSVRDTVWVVVCPAGSAGRVRVFVCVRGAIACAGDVDTAAADMEAEVREKVIGACGAIGEGAAGAEGEWGETLGLVSRWMRKGKGRAKTRTRVVPLAMPVVDVAAVCEAVRSAAKKGRGAEVEAEAVEEAEIEGV